MFTIVGLGNPGEEYVNTRHNIGRLVLDYFAYQNDFPEWEENNKIKALISKDLIGKKKVTLVEPETFMNKSGSALKTIITNKKKAEKMVVIYDDLDLPFGEFKISYNRGSGGHKGLESIIKAVKTKEFTRIRFGICPTTPAGKMKKPKDEKKVLDLIMKDFKVDELKVIKKTSKQINEILLTIIEEGRVMAQNKYN